MEREQFNKLMTAIEVRVAKCRIYLDKIHTTDDLRRLTIAQAAEIKEFCVEEEVIMTNIAMVDLYHVIGMGDLSPIQMSQFVYSVKEYLSYRSVIKAISKNLDSIIELPKIPVSTKFQCLGLKGILLQCGEGTEIEESSISDYDNLKVPTVERPEVIPYELEGHIIRIPTPKVDEFVELLAQILKSPISKGNFKDKMRYHGSYAGIQWMDQTRQVTTGNITSNDIYIRLLNYQNKKVGT